MALRSSFFNSVAGDRVYEASTFASYFASFIGNGVFPNPSTNLQVLVGENMVVRVLPGKGWINGYYVDNTSDYNLTISQADDVLERIDRVVMALDLGTRNIKLYVKKGTASNNPVAPNLTRNGTLHEMALADIRVARRIITIVQSAITDQRLNGALCGVVTGTVKQLDTTTLFNQYDTKFKEQSNKLDRDAANLIAREQDEFDLWFNNLNITLSGDVAGNLAAEIDRLGNTVSSNKYDYEAKDQATNIRVDESLGSRITVPSGTNILALRPGHFEGSSLTNTPVGANDTAFLEIDVTQSPGELRKQFFVTQSSNGNQWVRTVHSTGTPDSGTGRWVKIIQDKDFADTGWANLATSTVSGTLRYRRITANGLPTIHVAASIRGVPSNSTFTQIGTLPMGFRPVQVLRMLDSGGFGPENVTKHAFMQISESGNCFISSNVADPTATYNYYFTFIL